MVECVLFIVSECSASTFQRSTGHAPHIHFASQLFGVLVVIEAWFKDTMIDQIASWFVGLGRIEHRKSGLRNHEPIKERHLEYEDTETCMLGCDSQAGPERTLVPRFCRTETELVLDMFGLLRRGIRVHVCPTI